MTELVFKRFDTANIVRMRQTLLTVYSEVYQDRLNEPFFTIDEFDDRLSRYAAAPRWECVLGMEGDDPVGFAFGYTLQPGARWWNGLLASVDPSETAETGERTFALNELMVRSRWRRTGTARRIHDELVGARTEERVTLLVEASHPKVRRLYESWGYVCLSRIRPDLPNAPLLDAMLLQLRTPDGRG